jgi:hypothetical protein
MRVVRSAVHASARAGRRATSWAAVLVSLNAACASHSGNDGGTRDDDAGLENEGGTAAGGDAAATSRDAGPGSGDAGRGNDASVNTADGGVFEGGDASVVAPCSAPGLVFCDDFETRPLGATFNAPWSTVGGTGASAITIDDSVPAHSGKHSVLTHPASDAFQTLLVYHDPAVLPMASKAFYLRAQIRFGAPMSAQHNSFLIADMFSAPGAGTTARVGEDIEMLMMSVGGDANTYLSNKGYYQNGLPGVQFPAGEWTCFEMMSDASSGSFDIWVDGQEVPDMHVTSLAHDNYDALRFGFEKYAWPAIDIWWDDVAIGTERIGCD